MWSLELPPLEGDADDFRLLCNEVMRLMLARQLFTFVTAPPVKMPDGELRDVAGTNNESERTLRSPAGARQTGRASKTLHGARRRSIVVSVFESLRQQLTTFTLSSVIAEIRNWADTGMSRFEKLLRKLKLTTSETSVLDRALGTLVDESG